MSETLTCATCGRRFTVPAGVAERYPGWRPRQCRTCYGRAQSDQAPIEENLTLNEVLRRYHGGPTDGVFTDGSADPNPGPGGWGAVYVRKNRIVDQAYGHEAETTNNRMELTALIAGYDLVPPGIATMVYSDSTYCVNLVTKWAPAWASSGWRRKTGPIKNLDLVRPLYERAQARPDLELRWIKAHDGSRWNEYADALATAYRRPTP